MSDTRFSTWLKEHANGVLDADLAEAMTEVVRAVQRTEKPGTITLKLKVTAEGDMVAVHDSLTSSVPEKRDPRLYWPDLDGHLSRMNPMQPSLLENTNE